MSRESIGEKAVRYLGEARLSVTHVDARNVRATCHGGAPYTVTWTADKGWRCDCPAWNRDCTHVVAARLVTAGEERP